MTARCKSCDAEIVWATTTSGKAAPFTVDITGDWIIERGVARKFSPLLDLQSIGPRYTSHFANCDNPERFRKARVS